jgi:hypothetical protein
MNRLDDTSTAPGPGRAFRIDTLHLSQMSAPWFTGTWHRTGDQPADPRCALWITLEPGLAATVTVTVTADHDRIPGTFTTLARITGAPANNWTGAIAPTVAAHRWTSRVEHRRPSRTPDRLARAILAHLIVHR